MLSVLLLKVLPKNSSQQPENTLPSRITSLSLPLALWNPLYLDLQAKGNPPSRSCSSSNLQTASKPPLKKHHPSLQKHPLQARYLPPEKISYSHVPPCSFLQILWTRVDLWLAIKNTTLVPQQPTMHGHVAPWDCDTWQNQAAENEPQMGVYSVFIDILINGWEKHYWFDSPYKKWNFFFPYILWGKWPAWALPRSTPTWPI